MKGCTGPVVAGLVLLIALRLAALWLTWIALNGMGDVEAGPLMSGLMSSGLSAYTSNLLLYVAMYVALIAMNSIEDSGVRTVVKVGIIGVLILSSYDLANDVLVFTGHMNLPYFAP